MTGMSARVDYQQRLADADEQGRRVEWNACARNPVWWCNRWAWTFDPRESNALVPFDLFPKQEEMLAFIAQREMNREAGLIEKSRDVGATWVCCAYAVHAWLFRPGVAIGFGSRKLEYVDKSGDPKCIFEKLRFLLRNVPRWMLPVGFQWSKHSSEARILNPETGATIVGEGGDKIGRGGRTSLYFIDESAHLEHPESVDHSLFANTNVRIDVSTPAGMGNPFYRKRFSGKMPVFRFHWSDDPRKDKAWYDVVCERYGYDRVLIAQELDLDYSASIEGVCVPANWVRAAVELNIPEGPVVEAGLDIGEEGPDLSVFIARSGPYVHDPVSWGKSNTNDTAWRARDEAVQHDVQTLYYDIGGLGLGVKGTWVAAERTRRLPFTPIGVQAGESPSERTWPDGRTSRELFVNLKAELWWIVRRRFEKTYEYVIQGVQHPMDELISIPNHPQLVAELSTQLYQRNETGKIVMESKADMKKRGVKSPNFADALCLSFYPKHNPLGTATSIENPKAELPKPKMKETTRDRDRIEQDMEEEDIPKDSPFHRHRR